MEESESLFCPVVGQAGLEHQLLQLEAGTAPFSHLLWSLGKGLAKHGLILISEIKELQWCVVNGKAGAE